MMPTTSSIYLSQDSLSKTDINKMELGGTNAVIMTLAVPPGPRTTIGDVQGRLDMNGGIDGYFDAGEAMNITTALINRGYSERDIRKIWGGNFLRIMVEGEQNKKK